MELEGVTVVENLGEESFSRIHWMTFLRRPSLRRDSLREILSLIRLRNCSWCLAWHLVRQRRRVESMKSDANCGDVKGGMEVEGNKGKRDLMMSR